MQHFIKNIRFVRMMQLTLLLLILGVGSGFVEVVETKLEACFYEFLDAPDNKLCRGGLKVIYPEIGDVSCSFIPRCVDYRFRISQEWEAPHVQYPLADENKMYVLIMVDPDCPSKAKPTYRFWRHWIVKDISGQSLKSGDIRGTELSDYRRPTPPSKTGYHRYQIFVYEQPTKQKIYLSPDETKSYGSWDIENFAAKFRLGEPVASTQFVTEHYKD